MSMLSRLFRPRAALARVPSPESPRFDGPPWLDWRVPTDLRMTLDDQVSVSVAWACIRAIVDPIAASEIKVYAEQDGERTEDNGWLYYLLNVAPHPHYTSQGWSEVNLTRAVAVGNSYDHIRRNEGGRPHSLQPLDPARMRAEEDGNGGFVYLYHDPVNGEVALPDADVLHFRGPRSGGFYGDSPLARSAAALALARAQEQYATAYYANGAYPGLLLKPPAEMRGTVTKEQKQTIRDVFKAMFGGPKKAGGVASLDPGWDLKVVETDAEKAQMVEARKAQVAEIARYFGVPGYLIGIPEASQGYGKNLAESANAFARQVLEPWARRIEEELRRKLMPERRGRRWFLEYDLSRLKKGDEESIARAEEIALRTGVLTINEARSQRGLPSIKGGDVTLVNGKPLEDVLDPPEPPAPALPPKPADEPDEDEDPKPARETSHRAVAVMFAHELERYARKLKNKKPAESIERFRDALAADCAPAAKFAHEALGLDLSRAVIDAAAMGVEQGEPPDLAAERLLTKEIAA